MPCTYPETSAPAARRVTPHLRTGLLSALLAALIATGAPAAEQYRNLSNEPFRTVATGPMSAIVVDAGSTGRAATDAEAVAAAVNAARRARAPGAAAYIRALRRQTGYDGPLSLGVPDIVVLRRSGKLVSPVPSASRAGNELAFTFPPTGSAGGWTAAWEIDLQAAINVLYGEMKLVYGAPSWTGSVKVVNGDSLPAGQMITDPNALSGGVYNASTGEITFLQNNTAESMVLNLAQMMAISFHGPATIAYDGWEKGMARAAALRVVRNALPALKATPSSVFGGTLGEFQKDDPMANALWNALDRYDWLNQPALGNDRFFPVSKTDAQANTADFPTMLVPRLQMSGSAWLKVITEAPSFLANFNAAFYAAQSTNANVRNSVPELVELGRQALAASGAASVEGLAFPDWFVRQFVLDSSVSPGPKLYAQPAALRPDPTDDDFGIAIIVSYYRTTFDGSGNSDEVNLGATGYPIYHDYDFSNRLFLGAQYERIDVRDGMGSVAPTFFDTIGGLAALQGRMRVAIDIPLGAESVRVEAAPRSAGKMGAPNNFWGVVVGADTGTVRLEADGMSSGDIDVKQGAFGASIDAALLSQPRRATITFTDAASQVTTRRLVTGYGEHVTVLYVADAVDTRTRTFPGGPAMIAFPLRPLQPRAADALLDPGTSAPMFNDGNLLLAQWRQTQSGDDKFARYPTMEPLTPGKGYWSAFSGATTVKVTGRLAVRDREVTVGLLHGWNQIGNPYETNVNVSSLRVQYLADNVPVDLPTAISRGWIVAHTIPGVGTAAIWGFSPSTGYQPVQTMEPWTGYWIRVLVSEGVSLTFPLQAGAASPSSSRSAQQTAGWSLRIGVRDEAGHGAEAVLGQAPSAGTGHDAGLDAPLPPRFASSAPDVAFEHTDWGAASGSYFSDIRRSGDVTPWRLVVRTPEPDKTYTLHWRNASLLPRNVQLRLRDTATGRSQSMSTTAAYSFVATSATTRVFEVTPEWRGSGHLRITNILARPSRAGTQGSLALTFDLSTSADISAVILRADGRPFRTLTTGRASAAGATNLLWDARDDRGIAAPAGAYTVRITARGADGEMARAIVPVVLTR